MQRGMDGALRLQLAAVEDDVIHGPGLLRQGGQMGQMTGESLPGCGTEVPNAGQGEVGHEGAIFGLAPGCGFLLDPLLERMERGSLTGKPGPQHTGAVRGGETAEAMEGEAERGGAGAGPLEGFRERGHLVARHVAEESQGKVQLSRGRPAQTLGQVFTHEMKPYEVEILVAEIGDDRRADELFHILYDGSVVDEDALVAALEEGRIAGAGLGLRYADGPWSLDASVAWRTDGGRPVSDTRDRNPRLWLTANWRF